MTGRILYFNYIFDILKKEILKNEDEIKTLNQDYKNSLKSFIDISKKVINLNNKNINDIKLLFNSNYNSSMKFINETFSNEDRIFYNDGFKLDKEKEMIMFDIEEEIEIPFKYYRENENKIVFFFEEDIELNCIKAIIRNNDGINIYPVEITLENSIGKNYFLEDFNRFFEIKEQEYDTQTYISNIKTTNNITFSFNEKINIVNSTFKFFKNIYKKTNEIIIKYNNEFKNNSLIKLERKIYDKNKYLRYYISFDSIEFKEFDWTDPELDKLFIEDDIKLISMPEKIPDNIYIKIISDKTNKINNKQVIKTENFVEQIVPANLLAETKDKFIYQLDNKGGNIVKDSIKIYLSNKFANKFLEINTELIDKVSEKNKNKITEGFINTEKNKLDRDDEFFLLDFDSIDSLSNLDSYLGLYIDEKLYLPTLFFEENIYFRVSYDVEFLEDSDDIDYYSPFIFDFNIIGADDNE